VSLGGCRSRVLDFLRRPEVRTLAARFCELRKHKGRHARPARRPTQGPPGISGDMMVREGWLDGLVAGAR